MSAIGVMSSRSGLLRDIALRMTPKLKYTVRAQIPIVLNELIPVRLIMFAASKIIIPKILYNTIENMLARRSPTGNTV